MNHAAVMRECRRATFRSWVGAALVLLLVLAESFAVTHALDAAAHADGQPCTVCVGTASLGAGGVSSAPALDVAVATPVLIAVATAVFFSVAPTRRYARGPPAVSFAF